MNNVHVAECSLVTGNTKNFRTHELAESRELLACDSVHIPDANAITNVGVQPALQGMQDHGEPGQEVTAPCVPLGREAPNRPCVLWLDSSRPDQDSKLSLWTEDRVVLPYQLLEGRYESTVGFDLHHCRKSDLSDHVHRSEEHTAV